MIANTYQPVNIAKKATQPIICAAVNEIVLMGFHMSPINFSSVSDSLAGAPTKYCIGSEVEL